MAYLMNPNRVESFIEHQDACTAGRARTDIQQQQQHRQQQQSSQPPACVSRTASSPSPSSDTNFSTATIWPALRSPNNPSPAATASIFLHQPQTPRRREVLQLLPQLPAASEAHNNNNNNNIISSSFSRSPNLQLSIGLEPTIDETTLASKRMNEEARERIRQAMHEQAAANEARMQAKRLREIAEQELASAKKLRQQSQAELSRSFAIRERAARKLNEVMMQITCPACKNQFRAKGGVVCIEESADVPTAASYMSSVVTEVLEPASPN